MSWNSDDWKGVAAAISNIAPALGTIIGGPVGGAVGTGVSILTSALGLGTSSPEEVMKAIKLDPAAYTKIRQAEMDHETELQNLVYQTVQAGYKHDAAVVESLAKADMSGHTTRPQIALMMAWMLAIPYVLIGFGIAYVIFKDPAIAKDMWPVLGAFLGIPVALLRMYFGDLRKEHGQANGVPVPSLISVLKGK